MKIIFLDIDGVLNDASSCERTPMGFLGIDGEKVKRLAKIVDATCAQIVLVSTWKEEWEPGGAEVQWSRDAIYMVDMLAQEGLSLLDKTIDRISDRGNGISKWLSVHPDVKNFVILDDVAFEDYKSHLLMPHLVETNFGDGGLKDEHVTKAIQILMDGV